jgi:hypothetical protein
MIGQQIRRRAISLEDAAVDHLEIVEQHAFLFDARGQRRHRAGGRAADIRVVAARGDPEDDLAARQGSKHRRDDGDIGQVGAAIVGGVEGIHIARVDLCLRSGG